METRFVFFSFLSEGISYDREERACRDGDAAGWRHENVMSSPEIIHDAYAFDDGGMRTIRSIDRSNKLAIFS
jgi:hypothetical protein